MGRVYVPADTSQVERRRLRELLELLQTGVHEHNTYVQDFMQVQLRPSTAPHAPYT